MASPKGNKRWIELVLFAIVGVISAMVVYYVSGWKDNKNYGKDFLSTYSRKTHIDTIQAGKYTLKIEEKNEIEIQEQNKLIEEKIFGLQNRISDLYYSLALVVTLLLFALGAVYLRTQSEVSRYMEENYNRYKLEIEEINAKSQALLANIQAKHELAEQFAARMTQTQTPENNDNTNGES